MKRRSLFPLMFGAALLLVLLAVPALADSRTTLSVTVPLLGDINGDSTRSSADLVLLAKFLSGAISAPQHPDVNGDGVHNLLDLVRLMRLLAK